MVVGTVQDIVEDKSSNFYTLRLKPATNFYNLEYVYVIDNLQRDEQKQLEEATKKNTMSNLVKNIYPVCTLHPGAGIGAAPGYRFCTSSLLLICIFCSLSGFHLIQGAARLR